MRFEYAGLRMPVAVNYGGATYYFAYDQVGSLRAVADSGGNVLKLIEYDSFGNVIEDSNPAFYMPFGFAGGLYDADTGLVRFGFRDYDPDVGRWTAKDPILFAGGDTDLYGYVLNDPVNLIDPDGLRTYAGRINLTFFLADVTIGVVADDKGNIGLQFTAAIGFSLSAGVTAGGTVTNAPCINSLEGIGTSAGAAFNIPGFVPGASAEVNKVWTGGPFDEGKPGVYEGIDVGILGVGVGLPATPQVFTGITTTLFQGKWK